jgi:hypothetical protein
MTRDLSLSAVLATVLAAGAACGLHDLPPATGSVDIGFIDTAGLSINSVDYTISGNGITPIEGTISLVDPSATPSAIVGGIPPGDQYLLELRAATVDGLQQCYGASSFDITANMASNVMIDLACSYPMMVRTTMVNGMTDYCPWIASYSASSSTATVGGPPIQLTAIAGSFYSDPPNGVGRLAVQPHVVRERLSVRDRGTRDHHGDSHRWLLSGLGDAACDLPSGFERRWRIE